MSICLCSFVFVLRPTSVYHVHKRMQICVKVGLCIGTLGSFVVAGGVLLLKLRNAAASFQLSESKVGHLPGAAEVRVTHGNAESRKTRVSDESAIPVLLSRMRVVVTGKLASKGRRWSPCSPKPRA